MACDRKRENLHYRHQSLNFAFSSRICFNASFLHGSYIEFDQSICTIRKRIRNAGKSSIRIINDCLHSKRCRLSRAPVFVCMSPTPVEASLSCRIESKLHESMKTQNKENIDRNDTVSRLFIQSRRFTSQFK